MSGASKGGAARELVRGGDPQADVIRARLAAVHITPARFDVVVADLTGDPPLGRALVETTLADPDRLVAGVGAAMIAARAKRGVIAVRDAAAHKALTAAAGAARATKLTVARVADTWPHAGVDRELGLRHAWLLGAEELIRIEAATFVRAPLPRRITIAGEVARPGTVALDRGAPIPSVEALVEAAGGALPSPWLALDGGAWGGRLADAECAPITSLVLVLPAGHALIARARLPIATQLRRVASACEGCRACTDVCPPFLDGRALHPHAIVAALAGGSDQRNESAAANACLACGVCTAACPSALDPAALVGHVRSRLPADLPLPRRGRPHPDRAARQSSVALLLLRAGLAAPQQK